MITSSYVSANAANTSGTLFISSGGTLVAAIKMVGSYSAGNFHITSGAGGTVAITDPAVPNGGNVQSSAASTFPLHGVDLPDIAFGAQTTLAYSGNSNTPSLGATEGRYATALALLGNYMAASFPADGINGGMRLSAPSEPPLLARPHA